MIAQGYQKHIFKSAKLQSIMEEAISFFEKTPVHNLPPQSAFPGPGVYAIYYVGPHKIYTAVVANNNKECVLPIYVGKAVPPGSRTARNISSNTPDLYKRLREHSKSIQHSPDFDLSDFKCRFMILSDVESQLISITESSLIRKYRPLWNTCIDGFGNHDPGSGRYNQACSEWDVLHPGRSWAKKLKGKSPQIEKILLKIEKHLDLKSKS